MTASVPIRVSCKRPWTLRTGPYMTMSQQLFDIAVAQAEAEVEPDTVGNNFRWEMMAFVGIGRRLCVHVATMPHWPRAGQLGRLS
jgi:hypothetical protein